MLTRAFYLQNACALAENLLGKLLVHRTKDGMTSGMIVEAEAYMGPEDKGAHSYGGLRSSRTEAMFGEGGHAYVYFIYGMYHCFNVVANVAGKPEAVLIRALEPVEGVELMEKRLAASVRPGLARKPGGIGKTASLCSGPGKLCMSMGITRENYGQDLCGSALDEKNRVEITDCLFIMDYRMIDRTEICVSPRINIDYAEEYRDVPWRYYIGGNPYVSKVPGRYRGVPLRDVAL